MRRGLNFAFILFSLFLIGIVSAETNYALTGTPEYNYYGSHLDTYGVASYINDNDSTVNFVGVGGDSGWFFYTIGYNAIVHFTQPSNISIIEYVRSYPRMTSGAGCVETVSIYSGGVWAVIGTYPLSGVSNVPITKNITGNWQNVEKVKLNAQFIGCSDTISSCNRNYHRLYELRAFGYETPVQTTTISSCQDILSPGTYVLDRDISVSGSCFVIRANDVTLDLNGHKITGDGTMSGVSSLRFNNSVIKNGEISNFYFGVSIDEGNNIRIQNISVSDSKNIGFYLNKGSNYSILDNVVMTSSGEGIYAVQISGIKIYNNIINKNINGFTIYSGKNIEITNNVVNENKGSGMGIISSSDIIVKNNIVNLNNETASYGIMILSALNNITAENNTALFNYNGFYLDSTGATNSVIRNNSFCYNYKDVRCSLTVEPEFNDNYCDYGGNTCGGVCSPCLSEVIPGEYSAYWANMNDEQINSTDLGDLVKLVVESSGISGEIEYTIIKDVPWWFDKKVAQTSSYGYTTWRAGEDGESNLESGNYYFIAKLKDGTEVRSEILEVSSLLVNSPPKVRIISPEVDSKFRIGNSISFIAEFEDEDDDLKATWYFGDGESVTKSNCLTGTNCNADYIYNSQGAFVVSVVAEEIGRTGKAKNETRVLIYDNNLNLFSIIDKPEFGRRFSGQSLIDFDAKRSYVSFCTSAGSCNFPITPTGGSSVTDCYDVQGLKCFDYPKDWIGRDIGYELYFNWTFSEGIGRIGAWSEDYSRVVEFNRLFIMPNADGHWAKLKIGYEAL